MLSKKNRADKKDIDLLFRLCPPNGNDGKIIISPSLIFKFILNKDQNLPKISFIAPKSVAKSAVKRNLLRRSGYNALSSYINKFPTNILGVFIFKKFEDDISKLENEIKNIRIKIN